MTLASTYNIVTSTFNTIATQSSVIASNVANANTPGYSRQIANPTTDAFGGVQIASVTRIADAALTEQLNSATSESAAQSAIANGLAALAQTVDDSASATSSTGAKQNGISPAAMLGNFQSALAAYQAQPSNQSAAGAAVGAAGDVAGALNASAAAVQRVRTNADGSIAEAVASVNSALQQFQTINNSIISGLAEGNNVSALQDQRDTLVKQISQQIGITTTTDSRGSTEIFTDSGAPLFQVTPSVLTFQPSGQLGPNQVGNQVYVNGLAITGANASAPLQSGAIAGLAQLRDTIAPQYQAQLDQIAGNLIAGFQETDQSATNPGLSARPGLFTTSGAASVPTSANWTGLANTIQIAASVDPTKGGNAFLLRDGGVSDTTNSDYTYNSSGAAGYTGRLSQLAAALLTPVSFASSAGAGSNASIADYANNSVGWLQGQNQQASANASYQSSLLSEASTALGNATGVNLDTELTNMLNIENTYSTTAKLMSTVTSMFQTLMNAA